MATDDTLFPTLSYPAARPRFLHRPRIDGATVLLGLTLVGLAIMAFGYLSSLKSIPLVVNSQPLTIRSNQITVGGVLSDAGFTLNPEDTVFPALTAPIPQDQPILVHYAYPVRIQVDGDTIFRRTQRKTIGEALGEANVPIKQGDRIVVDGHVVQPDMQLPNARDESLAAPPTLSVSVQRAIPLLVDDNGALSTFYTTAPTLGEALRQAGLVVYLGDYVSPDLGIPVTPGYQVYIRRSIPASIKVDGKTIETRTRASTVGELLTQEGVKLENLDYSDPKPDKIVTEGTSVTVMRVREDIITESESIAYDTVWQADPTLEIDDRKTVQTGVLGVKKRQIRTRFENGREVKRVLDREWIDSAPVTQLIAYGTKIVKRDLTLPDGKIVKYWRKISLLATSYTAASSGKARNNPTYGFTRLGWQAGSGIVAIDPHVVNLRQVMYVPGYGMAQAGDTGGRIKGRRIDLGYEEENLSLWYKWVDVYLLDPVPPTDQIHWVLPDPPKDSSPR